MQTVKIEGKQRTAAGYRTGPLEAAVMGKGGVDRWQTAESEGREAAAWEAVPIAAVAVRGQKRLKVAAYCRVSTLLDSQETSIESQHAHYEQEIRANREWEFAGIYLEAGVSGTKAEVRPELQRMIADCRAGKIDLILTKSISRFARNTADCLEMVRELTALGVNIRFEKEMIDTRMMDSEFMLGILACLAEDESHSISGNMKWGIRKRFQDGTYRQSVPPYGYEWREDRLAIVPEQAEVVREIFAMTLSGMGAILIARELNRRRIPSARGGRWNQGTVRAMIKNPAYMGDALFQKYYKDENFRQRRNRGELDQYYDESHHESIVSREDFENAQAAVGQRAREVGYSGGSPRARGANRYCFSGILVCSVCGSVMHRQPDASGSVRWICQKHAGNPELCRMMPQPDEDLRRAFINCLNKLAWSQNRKDHRLLDLYEKMIGQTVAEKNAERLAEIEGELEMNRREARKLNAVIMRGYFLPEHRQKQAALTTQARELMEEKNALLINGVPDGTLQDLKAFVANWKPASGADVFSDVSFSAFVERCTVLSGERVTFHFRCGLKLTESLCRTILEGGI